MVGLASLCCLSRNGDTNENKLVVINPKARVEGEKRTLNQTLSTLPCTLLQAAKRLQSPSQLNCGVKVMIGEGGTLCMCDVALE